VYKSIRTTHSEWIFLFQIICMEISGKILQFLPLQEGKGKNGTWKKQEFVIETGGDYPKKVCISVWGDKIDMSRFKPGDMVDASIGLESREYNGRWYTEVRAWRLTSGKSVAASADAAPEPFADAPSNDDLPF